MTQKPLTTIGRAEQLKMLDFDGATVVAKIDTGADISSLWASNIQEKTSGLSFELFGPDNQNYTGKTIHYTVGNYGKTRIANSFGHRELRYTITTRAQVGGRTVLAKFTLADRSRKLYPVLIGRRMLNGKFLVDVSKGEPLSNAEKQRKRKLQQFIDGENDTLGVAA